MLTTVEPAVFAGRRLRAARVLIGASQTRLGRRRGRQPSPGLARRVRSAGATPALLHRVAAATEFPRSFFDTVSADLPSLTLRFHRRSTARSAEVLRAEQLVAETYRVVWQMVHGTGRYILPGLPLATDETQDPSDMERCAEQARQGLGLDAGAAAR